MTALSFLISKRVCTFAAGLVAGLVLPAVAKSRTTRKVAVSALAKGMALKDNAQATYESIKEDAQDMYAEARQKANNP